MAVTHGLPPKVRDIDYLRNALTRPINKWCYERPGPDLFGLAAAYCFGIVTNHVFIDGNKRSGFMAAVIFLGMNGVRCDFQADDIVATMLKVADGSWGEAELAEWFRLNSDTRQ